jgi:radical SAM superfamily enzyme with C-terminal helix-hairpin-helix motif
MRTKARVIESDGEYVTVLCERTSACDGCHKQAEGECSVCSLMASGKTMKTRAYNAVGAVVGIPWSLKAHPHVSLAMRRSFSFCPLLR